GPLGVGDRGVEPGHGAELLQPLGPAGGALEVRGDDERRRGPADALEQPPLASAPAEDDLRLYAPAPAQDDRRSRAPGGRFRRVDRSRAGWRQEGQRGGADAREALSGD